MSVFQGFTLAELLIALAILGVISTFAIPKILVAQNNAKYNAAAHEAVATIAQAYEKYKHETGVTAATTGDDIIRNSLNYVSVDTTSLIDDRPLGAGTRNCASSPCYRLHNGGKLRPHSCSFNGTSNLNAVFYVFDPDGVQTGREDSLTLGLYFSGRITNRANVIGGTLSSASCTTDQTGGLATYDPDWFSW